MIDFLKYFAPLSTDIERGYRSIIILITINELASMDNDILKYINSYPWFWVETLNTHESNVFINLGKIFDTDIKAQSIHFLKRWLMNNEDELKEEMIKARKGPDIKKIDWNDYKKDIYIFSRKDFSDYEKKVSSLQKRYDLKLKDWRNKIFAHREHYENSELKLESVQYDYIEQIYAELHGLYNDAFNAVYNGNCFSFAPSRLSNEKVIIQQTTDVLKSNLR